MTIIRPPITTVPGQLRHPIKAEKDALNTIIRELNTHFDFHLKPITPTPFRSHELSFKKSMTRLIQDVRDHVNSSVFQLDPQQQATLRPILSRLKTHLDDIGKTPTQKVTATFFSENVAAIITSLDSLKTHPIPAKDLPALHRPTS
jgi:hypothetical protein